MLSWVWGGVSGHGDDSGLLGEGRVVDALIGNGVLADAVGAEDVDDAVVRTFETEATPSTHAGGVGDGCVGSACPFVVCEEEGAAWLVEGGVTEIDAGRVG